MYAEVIAHRLGNLQQLLSNATARLLVAPAQPAASPNEKCVACFVDLARFTTISEALGRNGSAGTERLVNLINEFFTPAIDRALALEGDVVGFGGDALTVVFPEGAIAEALSWATQVMSIIDNLDVVESPTGSYALEVKIGIGDGDHATHVLGTGDTDAGVTRSAVTGGTAINRAVIAESHAQPGEIGVLVDAEELPLPSIVREEVRVLTDTGAAAALRLPDRSTDIETPQRPTIGDDVLRPFVHDRVIERLADAGADLLDEHRPISVAFVQIDGGAIYEDPDVARHLELAIATIARYRGTTISIGSGDKGTTLLAAFGAPVAVDGQRSAAIFAADTLTSAIPCNVGVSTGLCFSGRVGAPDRWSYTLMGDVVNTAARLMTAAPPGKVLVDEATYTSANGALRFLAPAERQLKGKDEPVRSAFLDTVTEDSDDGTDLPLAGRSTTVAAFQDLLGRIDPEGSGHGAVIVGDSGLGKSRLLRELAEMSLALGFRVARIGLSHRDAATSHGPWRRALLELLELAPDAGPGEFEAAARQRLGSRDELATLAREVVFGRTERLEMLAGLDARTVAEIVDAALADLILAQVEQPLLLLVDDAHDLDEASSRLLQRVNKRLHEAPVVLVAAAYPDSAIADWDAMEQFRLDELDRPEALELVNDHHRKASLMLTPEQLDEIVARVGGNPQLLRLLADCVAGDTDGALPNDARSIVLARFDRLPVRTQASLAKAAVLGRHFLRDDFLGSFGATALEPEATGLDLLEDLSKRRLVELTATDEFSFASPILWQVAYESSAHASRARAHRDVGHHIERLPSSDVETRVEDLAHHFSFTDDVDRHRRYFGPAGRRAQQAFANQRAITWLERAIEVADGDDRCELAFRLSATLEHIGSWDRAEAMLDQAALAPSIKPRALASLAQLQLLTEGYDRAIATLDDALAAAAQLNDDATSDWIYEKASIVHTHGGRYDAAADAAMQQREVAERLGDQTRVAAALSNSGAAKSWSGDLPAARQELTLALDKLIASGALAIASDVETDLAMVALDEGALDECLERLNNARDRAASIGYRRSEATVAGNLSLALVGADRHQEAWGHCVFSCRLLLESGDIATAAGSFGVLAMILLTEDRAVAAIDLVARTVWIGRRTGSTLYRDRAYGLLIDAYETLGDSERVQQCQEQQTADDDDLSDHAVAAVAPLTPAADLELEWEIAELVSAADVLIEQRGTNDD